MRASITGTRRVDRCEHVRHAETRQLEQVPWLREGTSDAEGGGAGVESVTGMAVAEADTTTAQADGSQHARLVAVGGVALLAPRKKATYKLGESVPKRHIPGPWRSGSYSRANASDENSARPKPFAGLRLLLVDDSLDTLDAFRTLLELEGAEVVVADNGTAALRLATTSRFDLILSDIGMPGMDGYELIARLRAHPSSAAIPAFALSGFSDQAGIAHALACGFDAYIDKPVTLSALEEAMRCVAGAG